MGSGCYLDGKPVVQLLRLRDARPVHTGDICTNRNRLQENPISDHDDELARVIEACDRLARRPR